MTLKKDVAEKRRPDSFSLRLDPKLRFAAELAAAKERRSLSSLVEWALDQAVRKIVVASRNGEEITAIRVADEVWDQDEARRLLLLAERFPGLLTSEQQQLRNLVAHRKLFIIVEAIASDPEARRFEWPKSGDKDSLWRYRWDQIHAYWETLALVARGQLSEDALPADDNDVVGVVENATTRKSKSLKRAPRSSTSSGKRSTKRMPAKRETKTESGR